VAIADDLERPNVVSLALLDIQEERAFARLAVDSQAVTDDLEIDEAAGSVESGEPFAQVLVEFFVFVFALAEPPEAFGSSLYLVDDRPVRELFVSLHHDPTDGYAASLVDIVDHAEGSVFLRDLLHGHRASVVSLVLIQGIDGCAGLRGCGGVVGAAFEEPNASTHFARAPPPRRPASAGR
jgi:hypothetical protein